MIGDVLLACEAPGMTLAGFENHAGHLDRRRRAARPRRGFGNHGSSGFEGCRYRKCHGTTPRPASPRNPWFADRVLADALAHSGCRTCPVEPLPDDLELQAHAVASQRACTAAATMR